MSDQFKYVQSQPFTLAGAGATIGDIQIVLSSFNGIDGTPLTMADFGSIGYGTLEPNSGEQEEQISFTGVTQNINGTATLTGVSNVSFISPYTETSGLNKTHAGGLIFVISNTSGFYNKLTGKNDDETITGVWTFANPNYPRMDTATPDPTDDEQLVTKKYADDLVIAGAPKATNTVYGISKLSVAAASPTVPIAVGDNDPRVPTSAETAGLSSTTALSASNLVMSQKDFQKGAEISGTTTGSANAFVFTPSPAISAYVAGMMFRLKANFTITGASTLNISGLGVIAIKKLDGATALASGDIISGQEFVVVYDGTNFQMVSPGSNSINPTTYTFAGLTATTADTSEHNIFSQSITSGLLSSTGLIKITIPITAHSGTNTHSATITFRLKFGGSTILSPTMSQPDPGAGTAADGWGALVFLIANTASNAQNASYFSSLSPSSVGTNTVNPASASTDGTSVIDTTSTQTLVVSYQSSNVTSTGSAFTSYKGTIEVIH